MCTSMIFFIFLLFTESRSRSRTTAAISDDVIRTEDLSFDRLSVQRSKRIRSLSEDDRNSEKGNYHFNSSYFYLKIRLY